ncbi:hypothetical protein FB451DRAFT_1377235 [Mycena latifolia]|nr:hypothetical protein FB451DRAFT_1377235 [Mycena latifolia]
MSTILKFTDKHWLTSSLVLRVGADGVVYYTTSTTGGNFRGRKTTTPRNLHGYYESARLQGLDAIDVGATDVAERLTATSTAFIITLPQNYHLSTAHVRIHPSNTLPTPTTPDEDFATRLCIMPRRAKRLSGSDWCTPCNVCCAVFFIMITIPMVWGIKMAIEETIATQRTLLSRITVDTPISGFYGPGAWWAWLVTLGMTHGHMGVAFLIQGDLPAEWDYDLIAAGGYIIAASIDLIQKSRAIAQLGEGASESPLLLALICAERVVVIGTGSSLFTMVTSLFGGCSGVRRAGTATIPLLLALVASFFAFRAHEAISHAVPVIWCRFHDGVKLAKEEIPFTAIDFPALVLVAAVHMPQLYISRDYWISTGGLSAVVVVLCARGEPTSAAATCSERCDGIFPLTGISIWEMDQLAALLGVACIAGFRSFHRILEAVHPPPNSPRSSHERVPLLPSSSSPPRTSSPQRWST